MLARPARLLAVWLAGTAGSCGTIESPPETGTTTTSTSSTGEVDATSSSSGAVPTGTDESTSIVWPPDDGITECIRTCDGPFDCCPAGSAGSCPGAYPWNIDCVDGLCVPGQCESDADCPAAEPPQACRPVDGLRTCVTLCDADPDVCLQPDTGLACSAATDEGESHCFESCDSPNVFCGNQSCDAQSGRCVCRDSGQCLAGWVCT
jgi:hypothetical protein